MNKKALLMSLLAMTLVAGCATKEKVVEEVVEEAPAVPEGFVKEIDSSSVVESINSLNIEDAIVVSFKRNSSELTEKQINSLEAKLAALEQEPQLIAVQGAAGPIKYKELGLARQLEVIEYLQGKGIQTMMVDYDENRKGGRANLWVLNGELVQNARTNAASLIIYP